MPALTKVDSLVGAETTDGTLQTITWTKILPSAGAWIGSSNWLGLNTWPAQGSLPATGKANGRVCTQATTGAPSLANATSGKANRLLNWQMSVFGSGGGATVYWLLDRIADVQLAYNEANGTITGCTAVSRLGAATGLGNGAMLMLEVNSTLAASSNTISFGYTNDRGVAGRVTPNIVCTASTTQGRSPNGPVFQSLQAGDYGIRSLDSFTLVSGAGATGTIVASLVRPLGFLNAQLFTHLMQSDYFMNIPSQPIVYADSCLQLATMGFAATGGTIYSEVTLAAL